MAKTNAAPAITTEKTAAPRRERKAALVVPSFSIKNVKEGESLFIKAVGEIATKEATNDDGSLKMETKGARKGQQAYLHLLRVINTDTGDMGEMVLPFLIHKALAEAGALDGREFEFVKGKAETNKATLWSVFEL